MATAAESIIKRQTKRMRRFLVWLFVILILLQAGVYAGVIYFAWGESLDKWAPELIISTLFLVAGLLLALQIINSQERKTTALTQRAVDKEMNTMRLVQSRYDSLLAMTTAVSSTLDSKRLLQVALELCELNFSKLGSAGTEVASAVLLFDGEGFLKPVAGAGLSEQDLETSLSTQEGIIAHSLEKLEPLLSDQINQDPAVAKVSTFRDSLSGICIPLRCGYELFGLIILGSPEATPLGDDDVVLLNAITDLIVPALQIEQLRSKHTADAWKILEAEDAERLAVARTLRDGPAQQVTGGALRIGFIRGRLHTNPNQALIELKKIEAEFRESAKELREMAFILRPMLNIVGKSLDLAIKEVIQRVHKIGNLQVDFSGDDSGQFLTDEAQLIVHYIVEAALFWAQEHGRAGRAVVSLRVLGDLFTARVEDNGSGGGWFQESQSRSKRDLPMIIMRQRARRIDGSLDVARGPAGGRVVTLTVPLNKNGQGKFG
jgi:signal transduction histidine kinase